MRARFGPLRGTAKRTVSSSLDVIFSHHSTGICLITQHFFCARRNVESLSAPLLSADPARVQSRPMCWSSVARMQRSNQNISRLASVRNSFESEQQIQERKLRRHFEAPVVNQMSRCVRKVACVWLNGRSVRIMARCAGLSDYQPYRAGPPNPTQSSAMISSPAAPTAGLSIPGPAWDGLESREPLAKLASRLKPAKPH